MPSKAALKSTGYVVGSVVLSAAAAFMLGQREPATSTEQVVGRVISGPLLGSIIGLVLRLMRQSSIPKAMFWTSLILAAAMILLRGNG